MQKFLRTSFLLGLFVGSSLIDYCYGMNEDEIKGMQAKKFKETRDIWENARTKPEHFEAKFKKQNKKEGEAWVRGSIGDLHVTKVAQEIHSLKSSGAPVDEKKSISANLSRLGEARTQDGAIINSLQKQLEGLQLEGTPGTPKHEERIKSSDFTDPEGTAMHRGKICIFGFETKVFQELQSLKSSGAPVDEKKSISANLHRMKVARDRDGEIMDHAVTKMVERDVGQIAAIADRDAKIAVKDARIAELEARLAAQGNN